MPGTSFVDTGAVAQSGRGQGLKTGAVAALLRSEGATINGEPNVIMSNAVQSGRTTAVSNEYNASNGDVPWEEGKDYDAQFLPLGAVLRLADPIAPVDVEASGSYTLTEAAALSNGKTGVTIVQTAGLDFEPFFGQTGFVARTSGFPTNPTNNRIWVVERAFDDGGNGTLEMMAGCSSGPAADPGVNVVTFWGQPAVTETASVTVQFGRVSEPGETIRQYTISQRFGDVMDEFHASSNCSFGDLTTTIAAGQYVKTTANWMGGKVEKLQKVNPTLPPAGSTVVTPSVNGAVAAGDVTMAITAAGTETISKGDYFSVTGKKGVYRFLQDAVAIIGEIAAPSGAFFEPEAQFGGFDDDDVIVIESGPPFSPEVPVPTVLSKSRGDGSTGTGGLTHAALVTQRTDRSVLLNCGDDAYNGFTGGTWVVTSGNTADDAPLCTERKGVIEGTIVPTATVDLQLIHDLDDRAEVLTALGDAGEDGEPFFFMYAWDFPLEGVETIPALSGWCARNAVSGHWAFQAGAKDAPVTGAMAMTMGESVNSQQDVSPMFRRFFIPAL